MRMTIHDRGLGVASQSPIAAFLRHLTELRVLRGGKKPFTVHPPDV